MSKRESAKYKIDRRMGENIWGRPKSPVNRREYGPGQHGQRRKGKLSDFGLQLRAKQKLKGHYGDISEKQFRKTYEEAARRKGDTPDTLIGLLESRTSPGPATLRHHDTVLACLRHAGFSRELTAHAFALIDSYVYGFALQEASLPFEGPESVQEVAEPIMALMETGAYPMMGEMAQDYYLQPGYDFADEFEFGLDLILDGLAQRR